MTYEEILQRMLIKVPNDIDKREGSIIYNALAPAAFELAEMYIALDNILNESFADTASREYLIRRAAERGMYPKKSTKAIMKAQFNKDVPIGSRFSINDLNYIVKSKINGHLYKLECETEGAIGNYNFGKLLPLEYIEGLSIAESTEMIVPGEDEEGTEIFRKRYFSSLDSEAFGGNVSDYKERTLKLQGVGGLKVYPVWNGAGTVKLVIVNSDYKSPSTELINTIQTAIDPIGNNGKGIGLAPIGHHVTVVGVGVETINISANITYRDGWNWNSIKTDVERVIDQYFKELSETWADNKNLVVRISQIEMRLLNNVDGVLDLDGTNINGQSKNIMLGPDKIPLRGVING